MAEFRPVGRVQVSLWGRKVGVLVPSPERGYCAFKFDRSFLGSGIQIAPLMMPLAEGPYQFADLPRNAYEGLPPCFADSLPDGFGNSLIRRWARERKYDIDELPALDKLCYVGNRAMGALCYELMRGPRERLRHGRHRLRRRLGRPDGRARLQQGLAQQRSDELHPHAGDGPERLGRHRLGGCRRHPLHALQVTCGRQRRGQDIFLNSRIDMENLLRKRFFR